MLKFIHLKHAECFSFFCNFSFSITVTSVDSILMKASYQQWWWCRLMFICPFFFFPQCFYYHGISFYVFITPNLWLRQFFFSDTKVKARKTPQKKKRTRSRIRNKNVYEMRWLMKQSTSKTKAFLFRKMSIIIEGERKTLVCFSISCASMEIDFQLYLMTIKNDWMVKIDMKEEAEKLFP